MCVSGREGGGKVVLSVRLVLKDFDLISWGWLLCFIFLLFFFFMSIMLVPLICFASESLYPVFNT